MWEVRVCVGEGQLEKGREGGKEKNFVRLHRSKPLICAHISLPAIAGAYLPLAR